LKILYFFLFLWIIFALLDPDPKLCWQDQVGGLHPGLSLGTSRPDLRQVVVTTQHWDASEQFFAALGMSEHLGVLY
jgi:hypothetical protein